MSLRGSIPFYWNNVNITSIKPKFEYDEAKNVGYEATLKHFSNLRDRYTDLSQVSDLSKCPIFILNLVKFRIKANNESLIG